MNLVHPRQYEWNMWGEKRHSELGTKWRQKWGWSADHANLLGQSHRTKVLSVTHSWYHTGHHPRGTATVLSTKIRCTQPQGRSPNWTFSTASWQKTHVNFCNDFWHQLSGVRPDLTGEGHNPHKTAFTSDTSHKFRGPLASLTSRQLARNSVVWTLPSASIILWNNSQNSGKYYVYDHIFHSKRKQIRIGQKEKHVAGHLGQFQTWSFHPPQECVTILAHQWVVICRVLPTRETHMSSSMQSR